MVNFQFVQPHLAHNLTCKTIPFLCKIHTPFQNKCSAFLSIRMLAQCGILHQRKEFCLFQSCLIKIHWSAWSVYLLNDCASARITPKTHKSYCNKKVSEWLSSTPPFLMVYQCAMRVLLQHCGSFQCYITVTTSTILSCHTIYSPCKKVHPQITMPQMRPSHQTSGYPWNLH